VYYAPLNNIGPMMIGVLLPTNLTTGSGLRKTSDQIRSERQTIDTSQAGSINEGALSQMKMNQITHTCRGAPEANRTVDQSCRDTGSRASTAWGAALQKARLQFHFHFHFIFVSTNKKMKMKKR
jgi:hypothetical protein